MRIHLVSAFILLAGINAFATGSKPASVPDAAPRSYLINKVARGDQAEIAPGITQMTVLRLMGANHRKLSANVWVYQNHPLASDAPETRGCDTLVMTFTQGKLTEMRVVNSHALNLIAASLKTDASSVQVAKK